jgi:hypothetical protein
MAGPPQPRAGTAHAADSVPAESGVGTAPGPYPTPGPAGMRSVIAWHSASFNGIWMEVNLSQFHAV